ncbi:conserved Plasmodium protein, unknown function [Plasmodium vivax]|uniref:UBA domain-containing protein n=6 Tax=Plasmodium vivax TaxID=5855 RepID=A5KEC8_PLAVS|nr:hypothetical protein, conserved [Plasmodium vivax]KMZ81149.1 hypothetical protein PVIIG_02631 [Plasmodium vivax India VII]KMZ87269.1 hypothetical protein PVBG_05260 [Plasmodium vivax Brazil I]KMZ93649.1 hypothetical protein PVMG_05233 [Plasmodium vivax Mauritania I]KNA00249.1 hypothetical protein PVNG_04299 [Plasmodium vivax North Korean]EDL42346.1 hypothetical protein, conserved [Plasmodium vivax]|eukprot:XP_001608370.1 hypothetical protein [Plasmodium vivax Sal-1]
MEEESKLVEKMIEFGYSKEISLRVIKRSRAKTIDEVLNWIEQSEQNGGDGYDADDADDADGGDGASPAERLNDQDGVTYTTHTTSATQNGEGKSKMTPEEAQKKAMELQKKIREKKMMKEKEEEIQKEKNRISMAKEMQKRREQIEEFERKKYIEHLEKEKHEHKKEKEKQLELLRKEYEAKFGIAYQVQSEKKSIKDLTENEKREEIAILLNSLKNKHKDNKKELLSSLAILKTYFANIKDNILEKKFQKIKKENKVFLEKIKVYEEMLQVFLLVGFEDTGDFYAIKNFPNTYLIASAIKFIDLIMKTLSS